MRHALVDILRKESLRDPVLDGVSITVSEVPASPDLKNATVFASPLGGVNKADVIKALNSAAPHIRGLLGRVIEMKFTPALTFVSDDTFDEAQKIDALLAQPDVARDLGEE